MTSAAAATGPARMTAEQLAELPDDGRRHELVEGELRTMAPASKRHGRVASRIHRLVSTYVHDNDLGECYAAETGFLLRRDPDTVRAPDVAFVSTGRLSDADPVWVDEVPDLVVEVLSPSDRASEVTEKALVWLAFGVRLVWIVDPRARLVAVQRSEDVIELVRGDDAVLDGADVLPGFRVPLADLFA